MSDLRSGLPPGLPNRMKRLPRHGGMPTPFFTAMVDDKPDFRVVDGRKLRQIIDGRLCFVCGQALHVKAPPVFVGGPMCVINRISAEPPSHADCGLWSAKACPFLVNPSRERRETNMPEGTVPGVGGQMISDNPGVTAVAKVEHWNLEPDDAGGLLWHFGFIKSITWLREGREASRAEVTAALEHAHAELMAMTWEGSKGRRMLARAYKEAVTWIP